MSYASARYKHLGGCAMTRDEAVILAVNNIQKACEQAVAGELDTEGICAAYSLGEVVLPRLLAMLLPPADAYAMPAREAA